MQRVVLVGCGFMGRMHASVYALLPNAELVAAVDKTPSRLAEYCEKFGCRGYASLEDALASEQADVVDICLPTDLHCEFVLKAARAGKNVFCEKPMARTLEQASQMKEECERAGVRLMIGHCIRFWPEYALLKELAHSPFPLPDDRAGRGKGAGGMEVPGLVANSALPEPPPPAPSGAQTIAARGGAPDLGRLLSLNLTRFGEFPSWSSENWLADERRSGGGVLDMHIHDTDFAHYLLGEPDEMVSYGTIDEHGPSFVFTTMRFGNTIAHLEGGWDLPPKTPFKMAFRAIFERGAAIMDGGPMTIYEQGKDPVVPEFPKLEAQGGGNISDLGGYFVELKYFIDRLESGEPFEIVTPETSMQSLKTALKEIDLIKGGRS